MGLKTPVFSHMSDLLHGYNVLRQGNRQSFNLKVALFDVEPYGNAGRQDGVDFNSRHNCSLEHGSVDSHGSNGV